MRRTKKNNEGKALGLSDYSNDLKRSKEGLRNRIRDYLQKISKAD